jgi:hypothetical protein
MTVKEIGGEMEFDRTTEYFRENIEWQLFVDGVELLGPQLNERNLRFLKAKVIEHSLCSYGKKPNDMINIDQEGRDIYVSSLMDFTEVKFEKNSMYTPTGIRKKLIGKDLTLLNSKGTNRHIGLPNHYASSLLILDSRGAAIVRKPTPDMLSMKGDSIKFNGAKWEETEILFEYSDYAPSTLYEELSKRQQNLIKKSIEKIIQNFVKMVRSKSKLKEK